MIVFVAGAGRITLCTTTPDDGRNDGLGKRNAAYADKSGDCRANQGFLERVESPRDMG